MSATWSAMQRIRSAPPSAACLVDEVRPVVGADVHRCVCKGGDAVDLQPTHVIAVQVGDDDGVDVAWLHAQRGQAQQHPTTVEHVVAHVADAGVEQQQPLTHADEESADRCNHRLVVVQQVLMRRPVAVPQILVQHRGAVGDRVHHHIAHAHNLHLS